MRAGDREAMAMAYRVDAICGSGYSRAPSVDETTIADNVAMMPARHEYGLFLALTPSPACLSTPHRPVYYLLPPSPLFTHALIGLVSILLNFYF